MKPGQDTHDPKGLIREAYRIPGITSAQCRTIFMDWALGLPEAQEPRASLRALLARHGDGAPDHPMTQVLRDGLGGGIAPRRRGGWRARREQ
ncbi:hypothetical protein [Pontibaca methylaminivorans]|uniref:hypothetical protein n=1 Tax=Pontibaca methylaminivorans TaxID=515897 RepID=UPI002FDAEC7D